MRQYHLLEPDQIAEVARAAPGDVRVLARDLVSRGWLTPFQANQLVLGRAAELLLGSYVLLEKLGEGGMGAVFKARNWKLGRIVALKLIRKDCLANAVAVQRFQREIRAAAQLDHPNIVRALDADHARDVHFLVMEFVLGTDLAKLVKESGPLPVAEACDYVRQAALGLQHAYERGLVHRDVKPHNLLVASGGREPPVEGPLVRTQQQGAHAPRSPAIVKILDFGLARIDRLATDESSSELSTADGTVMGTLDYIAPEQAMDAHAADIRADLYSLGCTLYHLLTGRVPFPGGSPGEKMARHLGKEPIPLQTLRPDVPPALAAVVSRLMAKRPEQRYATPAEAARALAEAGSASTAPVSSAANSQEADDATFAFSAAAHTSRPRRQDRRLAWLAGLTVAGVAVIITLGTLALRWLAPRDPDQGSASTASSIDKKSTAPTPTFGPWQPLITGVGSPPPGWKAIWNPFKTESFAANQGPDDKTPVVVAMAPGSIGLIDSSGRLRHDLRNYHLRLDFSIEAGERFALAYHWGGTSHPSYDHLSDGTSMVTAYGESQCLAEEAEVRAGKVVAKGQTFELAKASECAIKAQKPLGAWNTLEIVCLEGDTLHLLNGQLLKITTNLRRKTGDGEQPVTSGGIVLWTNARVKFRNVEMRSINAIPPEVLAKAAWQPLFNGKDLTGWHVTWSAIPPELQAFVVERFAGEGVLVAKGLAANLGTQQTFGDYHLRMEVQAVDAERFSFDVIPLYPPDPGTSCNFIMNSQGERHYRNNHNFRSRVGVVAGGKVIAREKSPERQTLENVAWKPAGQWNVVEVARLDDACVFRLNGRTLGAIAEARAFDEGGEHKVARTPIAIGSILGGVRLRTIEIRPITALPAEFLQ